MRVILMNPQIPQNTGNIVRTCAVTGTHLTLIKPLGFHTSDRALKRAGLDYWLGVNVEMTDTLNLNAPFTFFSSKAERLYTDIEYSEDHLLIFGSETHGLPEELHDQYPDNFAKIPMIPGRRCLNLSSAVAVAVYNASNEGLSSLHG